MASTRRFLRTKRGVASVAAVAVGAVVATLALPATAFADPVVVYEVDAPTYTLQITYDADEDEWDTLSMTITNLGTETTTYGLAADLATQGVEQDLWNDPVFSSIAQAQIAPGDSYTQTAPDWPGTSLEFYSNIDTTPQLMGTYVTPGPHVRLAIWDQVPGDDSTQQVEFGPAVSWSPDPVIPGTGLAITAAEAPPGTVEVYLDANADFEFDANGNLVQTPSDTIWDLGPGTVAADGTLQMVGLVPPDTPPGQYDIESDYSGVFGVHISTEEVDVVAGTPGQVTAGTVAITGAKKVGATLTATTDSWDPSNTSFDYQWFANGTPITDATEPRFTLTTDQVGETVSVTATGFSAGDAPASATSPATKPIPDTVPFTTTATPAIDGTAQVGDKLTADVADWTPTTGFSYQWAANGVPIGTNAKSYTLTPNEAGDNITLTVTSLKPGYAATAATSAPTGPVAFGTFTVPANPNKPLIAGNPKVGKAVKVNLGNWKPDPTSVGYQWQIGGVNVAGATDPTFVIPATYGDDDATTAGVTLSVLLTLDAAGYTDYPDLVQGAAIAAK